MNSELGFTATERWEDEWEKEPQLSVLTIHMQELIQHMQACHKSTHNSAVDHPICQCSPNFVARGPLLVSKNKHGSSHPCSRTYCVRMTGIQN